MKRRTILCIIFITILSTILSIFISSNHIESSDGYTYLVKNNHKIILLSCDFNDETIEVPNIINDYVVIGISENCFDCTNSTSIIINNIVNIQKNAFYNCENILNITLNNSNDYSNCFLNLNNVETLKIICGNEEKTLENNKGLWQQFKSLKYIIIDDAYTIISQGYFENFESLEYVKLPGYITHLNDQCFKNCINLKEISFSNELKYIGDECFKGCINIENIYLPNNLTYIGENAFENIKLYVHKSCYAYNHLLNNNISFNTISFDTEKDIYNVSLGEIFHIKLTDVSDVIKDNITYSSSNDIVSINKYGECYAYKGGQTVISISDSIITINVIVNVKTDSNKYFEVFNTKSSQSLNLEKYGLSDNCVIKSSNEKIVKVIDNKHIETNSLGRCELRCSDNNNEVVIVCNVTKLIESINCQTIVNIVKGKTLNLDTTIKPTNATSKKVKYYSSNEKIATVDQSGKIKAVGYGNCEIYISSLDGSKVDKTVYVSVTKSNIKTNVDVFPIIINKQFRIQILNFNRNLFTYHSYDDNVLTVNAAGVVKAVGSGICYISIDSLDGMYHKTVYGRVYENATGYGIDISLWNGNLSLKNFNSFKEYGIDFVYIRAIVSSKIDNRFEQNYSNALKANLDVGAYQYSYAKNVDDITKEANSLVKLLNNRPLQYPVMLDLEEEVQLEMNKSKLNEMVNAYVKILNNAGYEVIVYSNYGLLNSLNNVNYDLYIAQWSTTYTFGIKKEYKIWQFTSEGYIANINRHFDLDIAFFDYPTYYKKNHLNHN